MSSSANSPNHRFSGTIDSFYDPEFTADISNKMRVPNKIILNDGSLNDPAIIAAKKQTINSMEDKSFWMHVPERICLIGGESHASGREQLPEVKHENSILGDTNNDLSLIQLSTPPHTITLNEHTFPTVEQMNDFNLKDNSTNNKSFNKKKRNIALSGLTPNTNDEIVVGNETKESVQSPDYQSFYLSNSSDINDESVLLRRQVKALSKRIAAIEIENQQRHQREVVIYTIGVIYFFIKGFFWVQRQL